MGDVDHPSKVEISPPAVDKSHADCRPVPLVSDPGAGATPADSDRAAWLAREFPASSALHRDARARFFAKVAVVADASSCWLWTAFAAGGYGRFGSGSRVLGAHVVAWQMASGSTTPTGLEIGHRCHVRLCVRPIHLHAITHAENQREGAIAGRIGGPLNRRRLTSAAVGLILRAVSAGEHPASVGARFGVARTTVINLAAGRTWAHVDRAAAAP